MMANEAAKFIIDKEVLKPGLILFRRADVQHHNWYCRIKVPRENRYKTVSLKTDDLNAARAQAWDQDGEVRYATKRGDPVFNRPFRAVAKEYLAVQKLRAERGEITAKRLEMVASVMDGALEDYVGSVQVHLIADERWSGFPAWRREHGEGLIARNGSRMVSEAVAARLVERAFARRRKLSIARGLRARTVTPEQVAAAVQAKMARPVPYISDDTIRGEMKLFSAIMNFAVKKRYVSASQRFDKVPALNTMRREEFTVEEYRKLHTVGRAWIRKRKRIVVQEDGQTGETLVTNAAHSVWYRTMTYNMVLIACNTGMRPPELRNLRWRDVHAAQDRNGNEIVVLAVRGKGKSRQLVAPKSVGTYLERIREQATEVNRKQAAKAGGDMDAQTSHAPQPDDPVFTTITGKPAVTLYQALIADLLDEAGLRKGADGTMRTTYCFRHTYATFCLQMGVDVYFLAHQMGTSVQMIEKHYGHINTIRHADRVLTGMDGWNPVMASVDDGGDAHATARQAIKVRQPAAARSRQ